MKRGDWDRIKKEFERLSTLDPEHQARELDALKRRQPELVAELTSLLEQDEKARGWFDDFEGELDRYRAAELDAAWAPGRTVGPYRLERLLGSGGMGAVFLARKADGELRRAVALKLIPADALPEDGGERLRHERDMLARLSHPNIAHLNDAGLDADGQPWISMEFVDGPRIDDWCEQASPGLDERLDRFLDLCEAVSAAHRKLIVHGDIKPANVLIDHNGRVRLLDFGIARLLREQSDRESAVRYLSPSHAAPELKQGAPAGVASDIFALGCLLERLVADQHERPIELDSIIARACEPDRDQRYGSVTRLIDDLHDLRAGRAVMTHDGSARYRFGKWLRRHRVPSAVGLGVLVLIVGFAVHAVHQADRFQAERDKALAVSEFLEAIFASADPEQARGEELTAVELLQSGIARVDAMPDDRAVQADVLSVMARSLQHLGQYPRAIELFARVAAMHEASGRRLPRAAALVALAETYHVDGQFEAADRQFQAARSLLEEAGSRGARVLRAEALAKHGRLQIQTEDIESGTALLEQALRLARADAEAAPGALAERLNDAASGQWRIGRHEQALALLDQALATRRSLDRAAGRPSPETATLISNSGLMNYLIGQHEPAAERFEEALAIRRTVLPPNHPDIAQTLTNYGLMLKDAGQAETAVELLQEALEIRRQGLRPGHVGVAEAELNLAGALRRAGRPEQAGPMFEAAVAGLEQALGSTHPSVAVAYNDHAALLLDQGLPQAAEAAYRRAQTIRDKALPADHPHQAWSLIGLARALLAQDRAAEARPLVERALTIRQRLPATHPHRIEAERLLASFDQSGPD
jgi:serine/threonine-protein kinase